METKTCVFSIFRFDPAADQEPSYRRHALDVPGGMTVLEALLLIQAEQDGSLAFRYACRGAVCGSCAMMINGREALACRTQIHDLPGAPPEIYQGAGREQSRAKRGEPKVIVVEPLRNLDVVKDLIVEMDPFFEKLEVVEPWLQPEGRDPEVERLVEPDEWSEAEPYTNCILCACCHSVCPVATEDPEYLGPAALAQHYRFLADVRDGAVEKRLGLVGGDHGVNACDFVWNCVEICPKGVPPTKGVAKTRARMARRHRQ